MSLDPAAASADLDLAAADFARLRPRLFGIAYRILGSAAEAEDIVQDAWLRWQRYDRAAVRDAAAFLATTTTRLAINAAQSARARRETYIGPWLPEPVDTSADPTLGAERAEALELGVLLLLESLTPSERAAYVLREAFSYAYADIGPVLGVEEANARQLVSRARKHLADGRREPVGPEARSRLLRAFLAAAQHGNLAELEALLAEDAVSISDGNGIAGVARVPVVGRERVARFVAAFAGKFWLRTSIDWTEVNGAPAVVVSRDEAIVAVLAITASAEGIDQIMWSMSPAKLSRFA